ncbi:MAG: hypothetical protein N2201_05975 [candidate division WOR-3 bacterium]|nr:hypothetical protein [candidate division WOR-3 bacterium]
MPKYFKVIFLLILMISFTHVVAQNIQTIYLKDGTSIKGIVIDQDTANLIVETNFGKVEIRKTNILKIEYDKESIKYPEIMHPITEKIETESSKSAISKGNIMISGLISFTNTSGNLYSYDGSSISSFTFAPNFVFFAAKSFGIGFDISLTSASTAGSTALQSAFGPKALVMVGVPKGLFYFYTGIGINYMISSVSIEDYLEDYYYRNTIDGMRIKFAVGVMPVVNQNLGVPIEAGIYFDNLSDETLSESGTVLVFGVGLVGFLF